MMGLFRVQDELSASSSIIAYRIVPVDRYYTRTREFPGIHENDELKYEVGRKEGIPTLNQKF